MLASAELFTTLKLVGAAYLVWLGIRTVQIARRDAAAALIQGEATAPVGPRHAFREGAVVEALNPKTAAFFLAFIPQFVSPSSGNVASQFLLLGFVSVVLNTLADIGVAFAASRIRQAPRHGRTSSAGCAKARAPQWSHWGSGSPSPGARAKHEERAVHTKMNHRPQP